MQPVPGHGLTTAYGLRGAHWTACRFHTGADFAAPSGTPIVAPISGTIRHRSYGRAFGPFQFAISPSPGQPFADQEVFFAHVLDRLPDGTEVRAGQRISRVGALGNVTGPHLHMELHSRKNIWTCSVMMNPQPVVDWQPSGPAPVPSPGGGGTPTYLSKLKQGQRDSDSVRNLQRALNAHSLPAPGNITLPITGNFADKTALVVQTCQKVHGAQWGEGSADPMGSVSVGPKQAAHLGLPDVRP